MLRWNIKNKVIDEIFLNEKNLINPWVAICVALLHDTAEDYDVTYEELECEIKSVFR